MIRKRIFSFLTAAAMTASSIPFLASVIYSNTASTQAYAEGEYIIPELNIPSRDVPDLESFKFAADMELGWNLGNTLDAIDDNGINQNKLDIESSWCGVKTTKEMIDSIKKSGFKTIRIPVSWHNHIDENNNIDKEWLDRVQEIVDYAVDNDMHIILNIHHDNDLGKDGKPLGFFPQKQYLEQSLKYVEDIWTQVAERFKDYNSNLVFESLNEPRIIGSNYEWNFSSSIPECVDAQECINAMNQKFVDVVRASGGNNANRYLMVPAYCASAEAATSDVFKMPNDTVENKIMLETHAYIPYFFAMASENDSQSVSTFEVNGSGGDIDTLMDKLYINFISKNIPVIVDEFGAINKSENVQARTNYAAYYIAAARARGITCCWWDNNAFYGSGENFGILDRASNTIKYPSIIEAMTKYSGDENTKYVTPSDTDDRIGLVNKTDKGASVVFSRPIGDKVSIDFKVADGCNMVTGGVGFWIGGSDGYWVSYNYELNKSGAFEIDFNNPTAVSHTVGGVSSDVTDKAEIQTLVDTIKAMNSIDIQVWYANGFENPADGVEITGASIVGEKTPPVTTATTETTQTTTTTTVTTVTTSTDVPVTGDDIVWGDATDDKKIDSADVVAVAAYVGNPQKNPLDTDAVSRCDIHNHGDGLTASDALMIQQYLAKIITTITPGEVSAS